MTEREQDASNMLQTIAKEIETLLPENFGFTLLAYEFGDETKDRKMLYVSNSDRACVIQSMIEFIQKNMDNPEIFGKDV